ncbi:hypothetical protein JXO59_01530, partial [candidate division KSB1 bacterium]|nr:hypothetical protein [candidate division KSB1 bacterium]
MDRISDPWFQPEKKYDSASPAEKAVDALMKIAGQPRFWTIFHVGRATKSTVHRTLLGAPNFAQKSG